MARRYESQLPATVQRELAKQRELASKAAGTMQPPPAHALPPRTPSMTPGQGPKGGPRTPASLEPPSYAGSIPSSPPGSREASAAQQVCPPAHFIHSSAVVYWIGTVHS